MNPIVENLMGMNMMTDQVIATDMLIAAKTGIRNYAYALTETATPEVRSVLRKQLKESMAMHEELTNYMMEKGWYHPYNANEQIHLDIKTSQTALNVAEKSNNQFLS